MENYTDLVFRITDKKFAEELLKKGAGEFVFRGEMSRIKAIPSFSLINSQGGLSDDILNAAIKSTQVYTSRDLNQIRNYDRNLSTLTTEMKNIISDTDAVINGNKILQKLNFLGLGLSAVNLGVSVAGLVTVKNELQNMNANLSTRLSLVEQNTENILNINKNELIEQMDNIVMTFNSMERKLITGKHVPLNDQDTFLRNAKSFCSKILNNIKDWTLDIGLLLEIFFSVLPAYSSLFLNFIYDSYFEDRMLPANYEVYLSLYGEVLDGLFEIVLADYMFLTMGMHSTETVEAINAIEGVVLSYAVKVMDRADLITKIQSKSSFDQLASAMDDAVKKSLDESINTISSQTGKNTETCRGVLNQAYEQFYDPNLAFSG